MLEGSLCHGWTNTNRKSVIMHEVKMKGNQHMSTPVFAQLYIFSRHFSAPFCFLLRFDRLIHKYEFIHEPRLLNMCCLTTQSTLDVGWTQVNIKPISATFSITCVMPSVNQSHVLTMPTCIGGTQLRHLNRHVLSDYTTCPCYSL